MADEPLDERGEQSRYLSALAYRDYRQLWTASLASGAAAWALIVARGWLVYDVSDSSLWVGVVTFAAMAPRAVVTPLTGYLSDRFDRRTVLASMFGLNLAQSLVLAALVMLGSVQIWHVVVLSFVNGSARASVMPAAQALVPNLVPRRLLLNAVALNQATQQGSRLLGPAAIVPLLAFVGVEGAFLLCSGFYVVGMVQSLRIRTASTGSMDVRQGFVRNLAEGLVYTYRAPVLRAIILLVLLHCGLTMSFESLLPVLSKTRLNAEGEGFSYLMMAVGGGALLATLVLAGVRRETTKGRMYLYMGVFSGLTPIVVGLAPNMPLALLGAVGIGASQAGFMTLTHTMIQSIIPDAMRGRIGGVYSVHIGGTMALFNLIGGGLADYVGAPVLLITGGLLFVAVMVFSLNYDTLRLIYARGLTPAPQGASE